MPRNHPMKKLRNISTSAIIVFVLSWRIMFECIIEWQDTRYVAPRYRAGVNPVAYSEMKLKQNSEAAWNGLVSASLAYLFACWKYANKAETRLSLFQ